MKPNERWKLTITDKRDGECQTCFESVIGYDAKFGDGFAAFLCKDCLDKQIDHRKDTEDVSERPLLREETRVAERRTA
jgi:hypothetical protein